MAFNQAVSPVFIACGQIGAYAIAEAYHNPAAVWEGAFAASAVIRDQVVTVERTRPPGAGLQFGLAYGRSRRFGRTRLRYSPPTRSIVLAAGMAGMTVRRAARSMFERFTQRARRVVVLAQKKPGCSSTTTSAPSTSCWA